VTGRAARPQRSRWLLLIAGAFLVAGTAAAAYWKWPQLVRRVRRETVEQGAVESSLVPPFSTREPERYQATRVITSVAYTDPAKPPVTKVTKTLIARDGDKRREEYDSDRAEMARIYLETPLGRFVMLRSRKIYADLTATAPVEVDPELEATLSTRLLSEDNTTTRYQKLGSESVNGRPATRYRATISRAGTTDTVSEVLLWIDDDFGIPVRSETSFGEADRRSRITMELRDLTPKVDPSLFELPKDYRKVDQQRLASEVSAIRAGEGN